MVASIFISRSSVLSVFSTIFSSDSSSIDFGFFSAGAIDKSIVSVTTLTSSGALSVVFTFISSEEKVLAPS